MTPEQTLDWLAEQHKSQCNEDRPVQEWIRSMKSMLPAPVQEPVWCGHCNGSGRMVRDPDIGTDQECFVCDGAGVSDDTTPPAQPAPVQDDLADFIAGAFGVSRGTAYDMMREALKEAAPVQEPVAWATMLGSYSNVSWGKDRPDYPIRYEIPLYTQPPKRKPLTDEQIDDEHDKLFPPTIIPGARARVREFARAIEAAHGITGETKWTNNN